MTPSDDNGVDKIATARIDPTAEPTSEQVPGLSGQKESEAFAAAAKRHELEILRQEMGKLGVLFGSATTAPTNIAGLVLIVVFLFVGVSFCLPSSPELNDARKWAYTLGTGALGYLFGAAKKKD
ncbi:hypothetical protein [Duganella radicis]|uniref:Uncharacterized protein n=1 Tax=Duganella radicis TaxID=551988 RepID=A0A6L6PH28_9BURK|nr:hypothetical protein [Duganella radicis]MTV38049.1 hypothetical protein [Duganella radicis]